MTDFQKIYAQYFADVFRFLRGLTADEALAEELTEETFYKALRGLDRFQGGCDIRVWLCQIAKNSYFYLNNYLSVSPGEPENRFAPELPLRVYSRGMGGMGLPGNLSSASRFVRAAFTRANAVSGDTEEESVGQFFHILGAVEQARGCCRLASGEYEITQYTSCCNASRGIYYYTTYGNRQITCRGSPQGGSGGAGADRLPVGAGGADFPAELKKTAGRSRERPAVFCGVRREAAGSAVLPDSGPFRCP